MAIARWPLSHGRPVVEVILTFAPGGQKVMRRLLADTGGGTTQSRFDLLLSTNDCLRGSGIPAHRVTLGGAYSGTHQVFVLSVEVPLIGFSGDILAVGIAKPPAHLDGIACFRFLNRFTYGNFGNPAEFGLET